MLWTARVRLLRLDLMNLPPAPVARPRSAAFTGYIVGIHAPGRRGAVAAAGTVLLHMLRAHTAAYHALKREGGEDVRVGLVHQQIRFEPEGALLYACMTHGKWV